jgi:hypothetical protein
MDHGSMGVKTAGDIHTDDADVVELAAPPTVPEGIF